MTFGSCRFLFHQFIQRDKAHQIVANLNSLPTFAAAFVRRTYVDRPNQFMCGIRSKRFQLCVLFNLLDKQFKVLHLLLLQFDLLAQDLHFLFQRFLLVLVVLAHGGKSFIAQLSSDVVLIEADEQVIQLFKALGGFLKLLALDSKDFFTFQSKTLLHDRMEIRLMVRDDLNDHLHVLPDQLFQNYSSNKVGRACAGVAAVVGADEMMLTLFEVVGGTVYEIRLFIRIIQIILAAP